MGVFLARRTQTLFRERVSLWQSAVHYSSLGLWSWKWLRGQFRWTWLRWVNVKSDYLTCENLRRWEFKCISCHSRFAHLSSWDIPMYIWTLYSRSSSMWWPSWLLGLLWWVHMPWVCWAETIDCLKFLLKLFQTFCMPNSHPLSRRTLVFIIPVSVWQQSVREPAVGVWWLQRLWRQFRWTTQPML